MIGLIVSEFSPPISDFPRQPSWNSPLVRETRCPGELIQHKVNGRWQPTVSQASQAKFNVDAHFVWKLDHVNPHLPLVYWQTSAIEVARTGTGRPSSAALRPAGEDKDPGQLHWNTRLQRRRARTGRNALNCAMLCGVAHLNTFGSSRSCRGHNF